VDLVVEFLPFLIALYVVDSALFVRSGGVLFVSDWSGRFAEREPGLRFPGLVPFAEAYLTTSLQLRVSADGVRVATARGGRRFVRFDEMEAVTAVGGDVRLDARTALAVRPRALAPAVARIVERLRTTPKSRRHARLRRELRSRCNVGAFAALRARQARWLPALKTLSGLSALAMVVVLPVSWVAEWEWRPSPLVAGALVGALYLATVLLSMAMLRDCGLGRRAILSAVLPLLLFPPAVAHAPSIVARELYLGFEPLAVGTRLLTHVGFERLLRLGRGAPQEAAQDGAWDLDRLVEKVVRASAGRVLARRPRPVPSDASAGAFCPSCLAEYRAGFSRCSDCDAALEPFGR